jgi:hypothetical protein
LEGYIFQVKCQDFMVIITMEVCFWSNVELQPKRMEMIY